VLVRRLTLHDVALHVVHARAYGLYLLHFLESLALAPECIVLVLSQ
jgi:hypothetical protein